MRGHGLTAVAVTDWMWTWTNCGHGRRLTEAKTRMRPGTNRGHGKFVDVVWSEARSTPGHCPAVARTQLGILPAGSRTLLDSLPAIAGFSPDMARTLPVICQVFAGTMPGFVTGNWANISPDIPPDMARKFQRLTSGRSVAIRRIFGGCGRLVETRGEASTLKPAQNCVGT